MARELDPCGDVVELNVGNRVAGRAVRQQDPRLQLAERVLADDVVRRVPDEADGGPAAGEGQVVEQTAASVIQ